MACGMAESLATEFDILCLSMDEEVDEPSDGLEDLGIEMFPTQSHVRLSGEFKSLGVGNSARRLFRL